VYSSKLSPSESREGKNKGKSARARGEEVKCHSWVGGFERTWGRSVGGVKEERRHLIKKKTEEIKEDKKEGMNAGTSSIPVSHKLKANLGGRCCVRKKKGGGASPQRG